MTASEINPISLTRTTLMDQCKIVLPSVPTSLNIASGLLYLALAGCGGGSNTPAATLVTSPPVASKIDYQIIDTDNSNNVVSWQLEFKVLSSSVDGGYSASVIGNGGNTTVNGARYGTVNEVDTYDTSQALVSYKIQGATPVTCTYDTPVPPLPFSYPTGTAWPVVASHVACSNGNAFNISRQEGSMIGVEFVTVPAGTFSARKLQYKRVTTNLTTLSVRTEQHTVWYDTVSDRLLQASTDFTYANTNFTSGYLTHETQQLLPAP